MLRNILFVVLFFLVNSVLSQTAITHSTHTNAAGYTLASEGDLYYCQDDDLIFIGLSNGSLHPIAQNLKEILNQNNSAAATKISNIATPIDIQDAATKGYVDQNLKKIKQS